MDAGVWNQSTPSPASLPGPSDHTWIPPWTTSGCLWTVILRAGLGVEVQSVSPYSWEERNVCILSPFTIQSLFQSLLVARYHTLNIVSRVGSWKNCQRYQRIESTGACCGLFASSMCDSLWNMLWVLEPPCQVGSTLRARKWLGDLVVCPLTVCRS